VHIFNPFLEKEAAMKRFVTLTLVLGSLTSLVQALPAQTPTADEKKATLAWVQSLQKDNGGFAADSKADTKATLPATAAGLRALRYWGGEAKDGAACEKFVTSCYQKDKSAYAIAPGGKLEIRTTALGLMAAAELKLPPDKFVVQPVIFLCSSVKKVEDIRIAAAAYEAVKSKCELAADWIVTLREAQNADGTFGQGKRQARETAEAVIALLRLGSEIEKRDIIVKAIKAGQLADGGWGRGEGKSDLDSTYRAMRALVMLKDRPDVDACRKFVASCRNQDASYGLRPGEAGTITATYFAGIVSHWLDDQK
jgi:prenyltransferase beta subunit